MKAVAEVAALLADRSRVVMLGVMFDGCAHPVGELAASAGIAQSTASEHLARLARGGLVTVRTEGRRRLYAIADPKVATMLETVSALAPVPRTSGLRSWNEMQLLRAGRTCYDHLAGRLGVGLADAAVRNGALTADYALVDETARWFQRLGVVLEDIPRTRRPFVRACVDWTERREHLAGTLGAAVCHALFANGWVASVPDSRAVRVTPTGAEALFELGAWDTPTA
jgi:DNA-binding transcriptional ArsR family regulator